MTQGIATTKNRMFYFPLCSASFTQKVHLETHEKTVHADDKSYKCHNCDYRGTSKVSAGRGL